MERNYRSTTQIVEKAQAFISQNKGRYEKHMTAERGEGEEVCVESVASREEQYIKLLNIAKTLKSDTAFLYRDNESSVVLVDFLLRNGVDFALIKPKMNFFKTRVVQDMIAYLSLAIDENNAEALGRICNKGILFLKAKPLEYAMRNCTQRHISVYDALEEQMDYVKREFRGRAAFFRGVMYKVAKASTYDAINILLNEGYNQYLEAKHLDTGKLEILQILAKQEPTITGFLHRLQELEELMRRGFEAKPGNLLTLSTIHTSKGLEYDSVYMVDVYDGRFPSSRPDIFCRSKDSANGEQEERRLFYVGITRAKNHLHLLEIAGRPSSYIDELFPDQKAIRLQKEADRRRTQLEKQVRTPRKAAPFMHAEVNLNNSLLDSRYRNLPTKQAGTVDQILNENYDQEDYLIYDMVGFRRVKCVKCGSILPEKNILKLVKCSTGICQKCGE